MNFATKRLLASWSDFRADPVKFVVTGALVFFGTLWVLEHASDGVRRGGMVLLLVCLAVQHAWKKHRGDAGEPRSVDVLSESQ